MAEAYVWPELTARPRHDAAGPSADEVRERARQEGHAEGLRQGLEEARQRVDAEVAAMRDQLAAGLAGLDTALGELRQRDLDALTAAALGVCRHVLGWELRTTPEAFEQMLADALARLDAQVSEVDVYLHPDDHAWLHAAYHGAAALHADPAVPSGGLSVRTRAQAADYDPQALLEGLFQDVRHDLDA